MPRPRLQARFQPRSWPQWGHRHREKAQAMKAVSRAADSRPRRMLSLLAALALSLLLAALLDSILLEKCQR